MTKFVFKLQSLLNLKYQLEENIKIKFGKAINHLDKSKSILNSIQNEKDRYMDDFAKKARGKMVLVELREYSGYISHLKQKALEQKEKVKHAQENVDKVREELIKVVKEREMLDKLREKKYNKFKEEELKKEQKHNDEMVSFKHGSLAKVKN